MTDLSADRAQAESIGSLLLVAVVVISATTFGAYYVASSTGGSASGGAGSVGSAGGAVDLEVSASEEVLQLSHNGGSSLPVDALRVTVTNESGEFSYAFESGEIRDGGGANGQFDPGETWRLGWSQSAGSSLTITVVNVESETLLLQETATIGSPATDDPRGSAENADTSEAFIEVDAGPQRTVSGKNGSTVPLDGSVDSSASDLAYEWEITGDDGVADEAIGIAKDTTADPTFEVRENVTDADHTVTVDFTASNETASGTDQTTVVIERYNRPPVADAGEDRELREGDGDGGSEALANPGAGTGVAVIYPPTVDTGAVSDTDDEIGGPFVELNGTGSFDPDGDELQYEWTVTDRDGLESDALELLDAESDTPRVVVHSLPDSERQNVTAELTVTDPEGASDTDRVTVTVYPELDDEEGSDSLIGYWEEFWENLWGGTDDTDDNEDSDDSDDGGGFWDNFWGLWG